MGLVALWRQLWRPETPVRRPEAVQNRQNREPAVSLQALNVVLLHDTLAYESLKALASVRSPETFRKPLAFG